MKKAHWFLLFLLPPLFLTGCWDKKDPEDRAFIITLGVDAGAEGYAFTFAPANIETGEAETYAAEGRTLAAAVAQVDCRSSRKADLGQLKTVILSQALLEEPERLLALLREMERGQEISEKVMLLATEGEAAACVDAVMAEDSRTGLFLWDFYKNTAGEVAVTKGIDLDTFLTEWTEQGGCAILPRISADAAGLRLGGGMGVSAAGAFPLDEAAERAYLFLRGEAEGALLEAEYEGETLPLEIGRSKVRYAFAAGADGTVHCTIRLPLEGTLQGGGGTLRSPGAQAALTALFAADINAQVAHTIEQGKAAGADFFGILPRLYQHAPELAAGQERAQLWAEMAVEVRTELHLKDMGRRR